MDRSPAPFQEGSGWDMADGQVRVHLAAVVDPVGDCCLGVLGGHGGGDVPGKDGAGREGVRHPGNRGCLLRRTAARA